MIKKINQTSHTTAYLKNLKEIKKAFAIIDKDGFGTQNDIEILTRKANKLLEQEYNKTLVNLIKKMEKIGRTV